MEVASRIESRPEFLSYEAALGARKLVEQIMLVKPGEDVVITADTSTDSRVVDLTAQAVAAAGATPTVVWYETRPTSAMEPPGPVAGAIARADVWIEYALAYIMHSEAFREAMQSGARYANLTGMDVPMLVDTVGRVDFEGTMELGRALVGLLEQADEVRITTPAGTDLRARNGGRPINLRGKPAERPGETVMLAGQISWNPLEETQEGVLVFDGAVWPPNELGLLRSPIRMQVSGGVVSQIEGGPDAFTFEQWMESHDDVNMFRIAHWSLGFNPGVTRPTGRIVEDERVFGCVELGLGTKGAWIGGDPWVAAAHTDGSLLNPSIYLDGEAIELDGRYVHPDLVEICRRLGVAGY
ncbi:M29 family metallopeptidase [Flindersiella endophytica]